MEGGVARRAGLWAIQPHTTARFERAREDGMNLMDAAGRHRATALATLLAQVGVEGVQGGGVQPAELELAEGGRRLEPSARLQCTSSEEVACVTDA
jgi:hypothetical protein